jgi:hypothetical protein
MGELLLLPSIWWPTFLCPDSEGRDNTGGGLEVGMGRHISDSSAATATASIRWSALDSLIDVSVENLGGGEEGAEGRGQRGEEVPWGIEEDQFGQGWCRRVRTEIPATATLAE